MDFFKEYPQVIGLVPMYNPLPRGLSGTQFALPPSLTVCTGLGIDGNRTGQYGRNSGLGLTTSRHNVTTSAPTPRIHSSHGVNSIHDHHGGHSNHDGLVQDVASDEWNAAEVEQVTSFIDDTVFA